MILKSDIRQLNKQLEALKNPDNLDTNARLTSPTSDKEIAALCANVNAVLDERRKSQIEAERSNLEFKRAVANISHDLRTPLTSALGYLQMAKEDGENLRLDVIEERLKSLATLMNSLFEYAKIIEGKVDLTLEKINLCNLLRDEVSAFYNDFEAAGFEVVVNIPNVPLFVICDKASVKRIFQNLIKNAFNHGYKSFEVELELEKKLIVFRNRVRDIESVDAGKIFERFYTADLSRTGGNAGLGLAIAKELALGIGAEISAEKRGDVLEISVCFNNGSRS